MNIFVAFNKKMRAFYRGFPIRLTFLRNLYITLLRERNRDRVVIKKIHGIRYKLHLNEFIDSHIYYYGSFEEDTTRRIEQLVGPGFIVFDIGANMGAHTLRMATLVRPYGHVIAFEPMSWALTKLKENIALNGYTNITVEKIALSDHSYPGTADFRTSWDLDSSDNSPAIDPELVEFQKLDDYVDANLINNIHFIKLDVDGLEMKVLDGARATIARFKPIISLELGSWTLERYGNSLEGIVDLLKAQGYTLYREADLIELVDYDAVVYEFPDIEKWTINVIAAHRDTAGKIVSLRKK